MSPTTVPRSPWILSAAVAIVLLVSIVGLGATAGLAAVDGGSASAVVAVDGTTAYLQPGGPGPARETVRSVPLDASIAVTSSAQRLHGQFERQAFEARYSAADTETERAVLFRSRVTQLDRRIEAIGTARIDAIGSHSREQLSSGEFVRILARADAAAERAAEFRQLLQGRSILAGPGSESLQTTLRNLQVDLASVRSPAMVHVRERLTNGPDGGGMYVKSVGDDGLVVATIGNGEYRREALDGTQRDPGGLNQFTNRSAVGIGVAYERANQLYPWIFRANVAPGPATRYGNTSVYSIAVDHSHGQLTTYLDGATENVFREVQRKRLAVIPVHRVGAETRSDLQIVVNGTHATGPLQVGVRRPGGEPVDARILIDGSPVGSSGSDGRLWTIQPEGEFTVNATRGGQSVAVTVS